MSIDNDTITAIATPSGDGGIGIVRISGKKAVKIAMLCWHGFDLEKATPHLQYLGKIHDSNSIIDKALAVVMKAPRSYTGEDTVEFSSHGGTLVLKKILSAIIKSGARIALPGEFTKRAFLNGKMDLVQAEAVADIIHASSDASLKCAQEQLEGRLSDKIMNIHDKLSNLRAEIEATLDFPEEDLNIDSEQIEPRLAEILNSATALSSTFKDGQIINDGLKVAIIGPPNAGKSSIFNSLIGKERAIVHHIAGTTRDIIEADMSINGIRIRLRDTAGLRESNDEIEMIGVKWARETLKWADVCLLVLDSSVSFGKDISHLIGDFASDKIILCLNKSDLKSIDTTIFETKVKHIVKTSTKKDTGFDDLKKCLISFLPNSENESTAITNLRHKEALDKTINEINEALYSLKLNDPPDIIAQLLANAQDTLGEITGKVSSEDLLNKIFSRFCIGK